MRNDRITDCTPGPTGHRKNARVVAHADRVPIGMKEPMNEQTISGQEHIDQLNQRAQHIAGQHLSEEATTCQVCKRNLREGDAVTVYVVRAAGTTSFDIGYLMCGGDTHAHPTEFLRGVHELIMVGRIGRCTDVATQSSWPVVLAPTSVAVSTAATTSPQVVGDSPRDDATNATATAGSGEQRSLLSNGDDHMRPEGGQR